MRVLVAGSALLTVFGALQLLSAQTGDLARTKRAHSNLNPSGEDVVFVSSVKSERRSTLVPHFSGWGVVVGRANEGDVAQLLAD